MTNYELHAIRNQLGLTATECARYVSPREVETRTWNRWESHARIPEDVKVAALKLLQKYHTALASKKKFNYTRTLEEYRETKPEATVLEFRLAQAVARTRMTQSM